MVLQIAGKAQQLAAHPQHSVWVAASAGSGKTKVLTDRVLNLLLEGCSPERILCLTFTKAAAAEMANRLRIRLGEWAILSGDDLQKSLEILQGTRPSVEKMERARSLFGLTLDTPGGLKIQTIHSFCQSLLKRFPLEAGLSPFFNVANDTEQQLLLKQASHSVMKDPRHQDLIVRFSEQTLEELNEFILQSQSSLRALKEGKAIQKDTEKLDCFRADAPRNEEERKLLFQLITQIPEEKLRQNLFLLAEGSSSDQERGQILATFLSLSHEEKIQKYENYLSLFLTQKGEKRACLVTQKVSLKSPAFKDLLETEGHRLEKWLIDYHTQEISNVSQAIFNYSLAYLETYEILKKNQSLLDYEDLIIKTAALLKNPGCHWVLYKLDGGLDHILVDEAQDTSPIQWQVIRAIAEEFYANSMDYSRDRTLFIVGDEKQSIYSFQGADPTVFAQIQQDLSTFARNSGKVWKDIDLSISFRSTPQILAFVDAVFSACPLTASSLEHLPARKNSVGHVEIWPLLKAEKDEPIESWRPPLTRHHHDSPQQRLAQIIAKKIKGWLGHCGPLSKPISPGDILILMRRRTSFVDTLIRALKEHKVPVSGLDRLWLLDSLAVQDLLKIGEFLLLPEDDLTLATVLKGPLCNLTEDDLFELIHGGEGSLWKKLQKNIRFHDVTSLLTHLLSQVDFVTPFALFSLILGPLEGKKKWQSRLGPESLDSLDEFLNLCLNFQEEKTPSLQGFLHWISQEIVELKRDLDQNNQVRIMTVHGSKGLQAPIVFLPDTTHLPVDLPPFAFHEDTLVWLPPSTKDIPLTKELKQTLRAKQQAEYDRLLYVALTRAEDALFICGWEGNSQRTWYDLAIQGIQKVGEEIEIDGFDEKGWRVTSRQPKEASPALPSNPPSSFLLPTWLKIAPAPEVIPQILRPSEGHEEEFIGPSEWGSFGTQRGILIHKLLEILAPLSQEDRATLAEIYLEKEHVPKEMAHDMIERVHRVFATYPELFGPQSQGEVPIMGRIKDSLLSGQIDRLIVAPDHILCIDFKTHTQIPKGLGDIPQTYFRQMALYQMALNRIYSDRPVMCGILWTHVPRLDILPDKNLKKFIPSIDEKETSPYTKEYQA